MFSALCLTSCGGKNKPSDEPSKPEETISERNKDETLKILTIGNSFSDDSMNMLLILLLI